MRKTLVKKRRRLLQQKQPCCHSLLRFFSGIFNVDSFSSYTQRNILSIKAARNENHNKVIYFGGSNRRRFQRLPKSPMIRQKEDNREFYPANLADIGKILYLWARFIKYFCRYGLHLSQRICRKQQRF